MPFYYLSFCDPDKPAGQQFLGATVVEALSEFDVIRACTEAGRNPGGEIAIAKLEGVQSVNDAPEEGRKYFERFVPREEVMAEEYIQMDDLPVICSSCNDGAE